MFKIDIDRPDAPEDKYFHGNSIHGVDCVLERDDIVRKYISADRVSSSHHWYVCVETIDDAEIHFAWL